MFFIPDIILSILIVYIVINLKFFNGKFKEIFLLTWTVIYFKSLFILFTIIVWALKINLGFDRDIEGKKITKTLLIENLNFENNFPKCKTIFVVNYPWNEMEYLAMRILPVDVCSIATSSWVGNLVKLSGNKDKFIMIDLKKGKNYDKLKDAISEKIKTMSLWCYVENCHSRITKTKLGLPLRSGIFNIAQNLNIPITPVYVSHLTFKNGILTNENFKIQLGKTHLISSLKQSIRYTTKFFQHHKKIK